MEKQKMVGVKEDWSTNSYSYDICFCYAECSNLRCHRNRNGKHFKSLIENFHKQGIDGRYSVSDFGSKCSKYMEG